MESIGVILQCLSKSQIYTIITKYLLNVTASNFYGVYSDYLQTLL